ncbi:MAG: hypothetical protein AABW56_04965, partial [Nanoarchaeota archaeon]
MDDTKTLYEEICSYENLFLAYKKARKGKSKKQYVIKFESNLEDNLSRLQKELKDLTYIPKPLKTFIIRDPKLRKISKSEFVDRIVHHALCNIIEPIFDKTFILDSYANRKNKGNSGALLRLDKLVRKITRNFNRKCYYLKCDIKHYFETINREILRNLIEKKIKDKNVLLLIDGILNNVG